MAGGGAVILSLALAALSQLPVTAQPIQVRDEGALQSRTAANTINCTGAGVTCTQSAATMTLNVTGGGGGGAPTDATYVTQTPNATLTNEQALSSLSTGVVKVTTGTGVLSTATAGTDYAPATSGSAMLLGNGAGGFSNFAGTSCTNQFPRSLSTAGAATCASVSLSSDVTGTLPAGSGGLGAAQPTCGGGQFLTCNGTTCSCATPSGGGGGSANTFEASVALSGAGVYSQTVTGLAWVTSSTSIACTALGTTADGLTPEVISVAGLVITYSDRVAGTGVTLRVANPHGLTGTVRIECTGA